MISHYSGASCNVCSVPFSSGFSSVCSDCLKNPPAFTKALSYGIYDGILAAAINNYKFGGGRRLYKPLGRFLFELEMPDVHAVIAVPLSISGLRSRGFNQALLIAKVISDHYRIPLILDGLLKTRETHAQVGLSAKERASNLKGVFSAGREFGSMRLLLIDDVMTTGATADECSRQLLRAGAAEVFVMTLARAGTT